MVYRTLEVTREGALTWLTLARPEVLNAQSRLMLENLTKPWRRSPKTRA